MKRVLMVIRSAWSMAPQALEVAGVLLMAAALALLHPTLGLGLVGLYLVVVANTGKPGQRQVPKPPSVPGRRR